MFRLKTNYILLHCFANFLESNDIVHDYNLRNNRNTKLHQLTTNVRFLVVNVTDLESGMTLIYL